MQRGPQDISTHRESEVDDVEVFRASSETLSYRNNGVLGAGGRGKVESVYSSALIPTLLGSVSGL